MRLWRNIAFFALACLVGFSSVVASGRTQSLRWDAAGRLVSLTQRENPTNGFNWSAIYDAVGRRLRVYDKCHFPANRLYSPAMIA